MKDSHRTILDAIATNGVNSTIDAAFRKISKSSTAFFIWRIEHMNVAAIPRDQYGIFHDVDAYVIYVAAQKGQVCGIDTLPREIKGGSMEYHIHFWLGSVTDPDRAGVAAYKTVELDSFLNSCATQHRETEGNESSRFLSYFRNGLRVLQFNQIRACQTVRLYRVRGKRIPIVKEISKVSWEFFNSSDIFLIVTSKSLFVWTGRAADTVEKLHATKIAIGMKEDLKLDKITFVDDGYEKTLQDDIKKEFNKYLPLDNRLILPQNHDTDENGNYQRSIIKLYKCSEHNGKYRVVEIKNGPLHQSDLSAEDVFIIDHDINGIWVWVGRKANDKERSEALRNARGFVKKKAYHSNTRVTRVVDGYEPFEFRMLFASWISHTKGTIPSGIIVSKFDANAMEERPSLSAETQLIDDGSGSKTIWRVEQSNIVEIPKERHEFFFSGDCYIILYTYQTSLSEQKHLLYSWVGSLASQDEIDSTMKKLDEIDDELGHLGFRARIIQGRETAHLLQIFKGKLTIFKGKGNDYDETGKNLKSSSQYLLHVFGSTMHSSKAIQVSTKASSFNSNYCFVLKRGKKVYVWSGLYSTGDQREMAKGFAGKDFELVLEGNEKEDFFQLLGGKSPYPTQIIKIDSDPRPPRLFHCRTSNGNFAAQEMLFFGQKDLIPEHVMLLDTSDSIYMWIGKLTNNEEKKSAQTAMDYLQTDPSGRDMNIAIIHIQQDKEPPTFKGFFTTWDNEFWKHYRTFSKVRHELEIKNMDTNVETNHDISCRSNFDQFDKYPINILREPNDKLPARIDSLNKELHLTHDDFVSQFKMSYAEFEKSPRWKQQELKKKVGLF